MCIISKCGAIAYSQHHTLHMTPVSDSSVTAAGLQRLTARPTNALIVSSAAAAAADLCHERDSPHFISR